MKIGFYNPYLDTLGGGERYTLTLAAYWSKLHDVSVFWDKEEILKNSQNRFKIDLSRVKVTQNIFRGINMFKKLFLTRQYDLIFFLSDGSVPSTLARYNILHFQCPFPYATCRTPSNKWKLLRYQAVVCNSQFTKRYIDAEYGVRSEVIYPPVAVSQWKPLAKKKAILSVGRFSTYFINKKQREMVQLFQKISLHYPDWQLWLAGGLLEQDRPYFEEVKREIRDLPVRLFPNITFEKLQRLYGEAFLYWNAAGFGESEETNPAGMEHFGIATVEAMAAGAVPVVFAGGGQPEVVEHGNSGYLWSTAEELIERTHELIENVNKRETMRRQGETRAVVFDESMFKKAFDALLERIAKSQ